MMLTAITTTAASATEALGIVRALSEGRARITPRPVGNDWSLVMAAPAVAGVGAGEAPAPAPATPRPDTLADALDRLVARGEPFDMFDLQNEWEGFATREHMRGMVTSLVILGRLEPLPKGDPRRGPQSCGVRSHVTQWRRV